MGTRYVSYTAVHDFIESRNNLRTSWALEKQIQYMCLMFWYCKNIQLVRHFLFYFSVMDTVIGLCCGSILTVISKDRITQKTYRFILQITRT